MLNEKVNTLKNIWAKIFIYFNTERKKRIDNINLTKFSRICPELTSVPMMKLAPQLKVWSDREESTEDSTIPN